MFIWDIEAALAPLTKSSEAADEERSSGTNGSGISSLRTIGSSNNITNVPQGYVPISAKGHKESVYALAMNDTGNVLVSGGTEKVICVVNSYRSFYYSVKS